MEAQVPFAEILELLEKHGWTLHRIDPPYRVFVKGDQLPIVIPVHDRKVHASYVAKIDQIIASQRDD